MSTIRTALGSLSTRGRLLLGGSLVGVLLVAFLLLRVAGQTTYATVLSGLDPAETGKVTAALDERGIAYELQNNGTALAVDKARTAEARVALAEKGLPGQGKPGFELFDKQKLGASDFQQQVSYQRALEGEISRQLEAVQGVSGAQVTLVLPEEQLFAEEGNPATAAVLLSGNTEDLDPGSVRGMAQLVASSVKGLKPANVSITDATGQLLWPREEGGAPGTGGSATAKQAAETRYEGQLEGKLNAMMATTLGPSKARVQVKADLNTDEATEDRLTYARRSTPLRERVERERLRGTGGRPGGRAGAEGNIPPYAERGGEGNSNYNRETEERDRAVGKTVRRTKVAPGRVERLGVSLLVDDTVPPGDVAELRRAVESAAGIDQARGDTLAVASVPFAQPPERTEGGPVPALVDWIRYGALAAALAAFLVFLARHLRRREHEALGSAAWLEEIAEPAPLAALEARQVQELEAQQSTALIEEQHHHRVRRQIEQLVDREPERVAQQLRAWMSEED